MQMLRKPTVVLIAVLVLWAIAYLPNLGVRPLRLEEGRRATPAREMLQSGNFALPTLYGEAYLNKPPMFFWVVAATGWVQGEVNALSTRLPSVLSLLAAAVLITRFAAKDLPVETRHLSALLLLATVAMVDKGPLGEIESFLALLILAAMVCWWRGYRDVKIRWVAWPLAGLILGAANLTKGPPALVEFYLPLVVFLVWQRQWKLLLAPAHLVGAVLIVVPMGIWVWGLYAGNPAGFGQTLQVWSDQMGVNRVTDPGAEPGTLTRYLTFPLETVTTFSPWIFFMIPAFIRAPKKAAPRGFPLDTVTESSSPAEKSPATESLLGIPRDLRRFLLAYVIVTFVFFWLWPNARPRHMMAICFPIVSLAAICIMAGCRLGSPQHKWLQAALPAALGIAVAICIGRSVYAWVVLPKLAAKDATTQTVAALMPELKKMGDLPRYTTFTFVSQTGEGMYNAQFYFGERITGVGFKDGQPDFSALPKAPVVLYCSPQQEQVVETSNQWAVQRLTEIMVKTPDGREVPVRVLMVRGK